MWFELRILRWRVHLGLSVWTLNPVTSFLMRHMGKIWWTEWKGLVKMKTETGVLHQWPRNTHSHQKLLEEANRICSRATKGGDLEDPRERNFKHILWVRNRQNLKDGSFLPEPNDKETPDQRSRVKPDPNGEWHCLPNLTLPQCHESVPGFIIGANLINVLEWSTVDLEFHISTTNLPPPDNFSPYS